MGPRDLKAVKVVKKGDYLYVKVPGHPNATTRGYVLQHRFVKEQELGRFLTSQEVVHHEDENKKNNDSKNLVLKSVSGHMRDHGFARRRPRIVLKCAECGKKIERSWGQTPKQRGFKRSFCSHSCSAKFNRRGTGKQIHGTNSSYRNYGCRCRSCKEAHRIDVARWRRKSS